MSVYNPTPDEMERMGRMGVHYSASVRSTCERDLRTRPERTPEQLARMLGTDVLEREGLRRAYASVVALLESREGARSREWQGLEFGDLMDHLRGHLEAIEDGSERDADTGRLHVVHLLARAFMVAARCIELDGGEG